MSLYNTEISRGSLMPLESKRIAALLLTEPDAATWKQSIQADYQMREGMPVFEMRAPLVGYALRRWAFDCTLQHDLDPKTHQLSLSNVQTLYGVESADLAPGYSAIQRGIV